jgi:Flp pilus assembly protein TadG
MISTLLRTRRCVAALEFALIAPTLIMIFAGVADIGFALYKWSELEQALALGANFAIMNKSKVEATDGQTLADNIAKMVANSNNSDMNATATVVVNNGPTATVTTGNTPNESGTASNANSYYCLTGSPTNWAWGAAYSDNTHSCTDGSQSGQFVTITVSYTYTPFFNYGFVTNGAMTDGAVVQAN